MGFITSCASRPHPQAVSSSSARSNQNVAQGEGGAPHSKPPVVHPRSSQYRWMKSEWRANVYLARSRIQVSVQNCVLFLARLLQDS